MRKHSNFKLNTGWVEVRIKQPVCRGKSIWAKGTKKQATTEVDRMNEATSYERLASLAFGSESAKWQYKSRAQEDWKQMQAAAATARDNTTELGGGDVALTLFYFEREAFIHAALSNDAVDVQKQQGINSRPSRAPAHTSTSDCLLHESELVDVTDQSI
ncbi:hypothetical protein C8J57DRAFT_1236044 [Mycena rebaudengoi]|nr:hypothetical protein C8J57DRAFT_1236044 [Mycena rebaudengoi]